MAGRSRRTNDATFQDDEKHFLFREYLHIIERFEPTVFVMENVKGLLSSTNRGTKMFDLIRSDLSSPRSGLEYEIRSFVVDKEPAELAPKDFIIRSEDYGVPQKRHRVILLGLRKGFDFGAFHPLEPCTPDDRAERNRRSPSRALPDQPSQRRHALIVGGASGVCLGRGGTHKATQGAHLTQGEPSAHPCSEGHHVRV